MAFLSKTTVLSPFRRIALVGDAVGIPSLVRHVPEENVACIIAASLRPQYLGELVAIAGGIGRPLLVQAPAKSVAESQAFLEEFHEISCDGLLCYSYSMKIPPVMLEAVKGNAVNIHGALLPKNRGPNPIQWALIKGERRAGVTAHQMVEEIDAGPIIDQVPVEISFEDTWVSLRDKVSSVTETMLDSLIPRLIRGNVVCVPQGESQASTNHRLTPDYPKIDFTHMSDHDVYNLIRAQVSPLRGAFLEDEHGERIYFEHYVPYERIHSIRELWGKADFASIARNL